MVSEEWRERFRRAFEARIMTPQELSTIRNGAVNGRRGIHQVIDPEDAHTIGGVGELLFAQTFGLSVDARPQPTGDGGRDFVVHHGGKPLRIDVKTSRHRERLLVPAYAIDTKRCADIFVLCYFDGTLGCLEGWEHLGVMQRAPVRNFGRIDCYYRPIHLLRPLGQLAELMGRRDNGEPAS